MWSGIGSGPDGTHDANTLKVPNNDHDKSPCERNVNKSFRSAETMASSTGRKSSGAAHEPRLHASTKQFKADYTSSNSSSGKMSSSRAKRAKMSPPVRKIWPTSTFTLERQPCGVPVEFDIYDEIDLPFLDKATEVGRMVSKNIITQALDDDVMTDDEMIAAANKLLTKEVEKSIKQFNSGFDKSYIRNLKL